ELRTAQVDRGAAAALFFVILVFSNGPPPSEFSTLSLHDALPICPATPPARPSSMLSVRSCRMMRPRLAPTAVRIAISLCRPAARSEEHTSELQSLRHLVCRLLLEKKKTLQKLHRFACFTPTSFLL